MFESNTEKSEEHTGPVIIPINGSVGKLYTLKILELDGKLYISDGVKEEQVNEETYKNRHAYKVFDKTVDSSAINAYSNIKNIFGNGEVVVTVDDKTIESTSETGPEHIAESKISTVHLDIEESKPVKDHKKGGNNKYVYNRDGIAYPKNVSFSKRNPQKKHNKKTIRRLQNIINNSQVQI
jgi:hypothetical protein